MLSSENWTFQVWQQLVSAASMWLAQLQACNWDTKRRGHWQRKLRHLEKLMPKEAEGAPDWGTSSGSRIWNDVTKGRSLRLQDTSTKGQSHRSLNLHSIHCANLHHHYFPHTFLCPSFTEFCSKSPESAWVSAWLGPRCGPAHQQKRLAEKLKPKRRHGHF